MRNPIGRLTKPDRYLYIGALPLPRVTRVTIDGAPDFLRGVRALFCADVHLRGSTREERLNALIDRIASERADMLLLGGDYGEGAAQCARFFRALRRVSFPMGVYAALGNNDARDLAALPEAAFVRILKNSRADVEINGGTLEIAACDDYRYGHPDTERLFSEARNHYRLLLSHQPVMPECRADLMLSGHTHGGQMNFFGITPYTVGFESRYGMIAVRGMHRFDDMRLYVSNGIGVSRLPLRVGAAPELTLIEFE